MAKDSTSEEQDVSEEHHTSENHDTCAGHETSVEHDIPKEGTGSAEHDPFEEYYTALEEYNFSRARGRGGNGAIAR